MDAEPAVVHREHVAQEPEPRVPPRHGLVDGLLDVDEPLGGEVLGDDRHHDEVAGQECRPGAELEVRRAVDEDDVEVALTSARKSRRASCFSPDSSGRGVLWSVRSLVAGTIEMFANAVAWMSSSGSGS